MVTEQIKLAVRSDRRTQREIAQQAGLDPASLSRWMRNRVDIRAQTLDRIAAAVGVRVVLAGDDVLPCRTSER